MITFALGTLLAQFGNGLEPPANTLYTQDATSDPLTGLEKIISNMIGLLTIVSVIGFLYFFLTAALNMIGAAGDSGKITKARDQMMHATAGIAITVAAYGVVGLIGSVIGLDILNPKALLSPLVPN